MLRVRRAFPWESWVEPRDDALQAEDGVQGNAHAFGCAGVEVVTAARAVLREHFV